MSTKDVRARFERLQAKGVLELLYVESGMPGRRWTFKVKGGASRTLTTSEADTFLDGLAAGWAAAHDPYDAEPVKEV